MSSRLVRTAGAVVATVALIALGALPAAATNPGEGAVIFNPDGTPIGSELLYGDPAATPQFVYTAETGDDDYWGLDSGSEPANYEGNFNSVDTGIPLGFTINVNGVVYDGALVSSNGGICLVSSTDPGANESYDECTSFYDDPLATLVDPDYESGPDNYAAFLPFNQDQNPNYADTPVDTDADTVPDACTFGAFLFEFETDFFCSSVFWGTTTYEGKTAFVATWYHDPDYDADDDEDIFNTFQVLLVNDGGGNVTVVYNYDDVLNSGDDLSSSVPNDNLAREACGIQYQDGDEEDYLFGGLIGTNFATTPLSLALFGPACDSPIFDQDAASLINGGAFPLIENSLNSTVPGRYIFAMVNGQPVVTPAVAPAPALAVTGTNATVPVFIALSGLLVGGALLMYRRIHSTN